MAAAVKTEQNINEVDRPPDKERAHEPMAELNDVIDLKSVLGSIRRLAEELVNQGQMSANHIDSNPRPSVPDVAQAACASVARDEIQRRRLHRAQTWLPP